jgi:hypothetical protein
MKWEIRFQGIQIIIIQNIKSFHNNRIKIHIFH